MKKYISKFLLVMGWMLILGGVLGAAGASDLGNIGCGQALLQVAVCAGLGLVCFAGRWLLCRKRKRG